MKFKNFELEERGFECFYNFSVQSLEFRLLTPLNRKLNLVGNIDKIPKKKVLNIFVFFIG